MSISSKLTLKTPFLLAVAMLLLWQTGQAQSLAELSRQVRAKKESKTVKEFTNDNIPAVGLSGASDAAAPAADGKPGEAKTADGAKPAAPAEEKAERKTAAEVEKEYREKAAKLKETVQLEERRLDVLQRELNLTQQQYYADPNVALREQYSRDDINKRTAEIDAQRAAVEKAKQAITDLEEELRRNQLPAGWAR